MLRLTEAQVALLDADGQKAYKAMVKENEALAQAVSGGGKFSLRVGQKGTISINGFGRWPFSPYVEQIDRFRDWLLDGVSTEVRKQVLSHGGFAAIEAFKVANKDKLSTKAGAIVAAASTPVDKGAVQPAVK